VTIAAGRAGKNLGIMKRNQTPRRNLVDGESRESFPKVSTNPVIQAEERKERRLAANKKAIERRQVLELSECTFKPAMSKRSMKIGSLARASWPSLHEPKVMKATSVKADKEVVPEPTIDPYSEILCEQHDRSGPIHDRLMSYGERIRYKKKILVDQKHLMEKSMSPKNVIPLAKSEKRSKSRTEVEALNDEYLRGN
jgi:hypothetical protein